MFIAYNLRRISNILTPVVLKEYLRMLASLFYDILASWSGKISQLEKIFSGTCILRYVPGYGLNHSGIPRKTFRVSSY
jgi:hypothetical protein